jgi:hypothetical protein
MKPWFVKEADIIKFPEPEKKVIELPNVQSYPDFLTGVKDLYNRKEKGEISQDSHDRLYQDLIHRFMKNESFENPWFLREATRKLVNGTDRGRMNEIILAVAIFSKFIAGNNKIQNGDVIKQLNTLAKYPGGFKRKNSEKDPIVLKIQDRGDIIVKDIQDMAQNLPLLKDEIEGNTDFANSDSTSDKLSQVYAQNGKPDQVLVSQLGGGRGKTDVLLQYIEPGQDPKTLRPYSAKTFSDRLDNKDVNSIEELNGYLDNFGVKLNAEGIIDRSDSAIEVFKNAFDSVTGQMNSLLSGDSEKGEQTFIKQLFNFLKEMGTRGDEDLLLVDNRKGKASVYDFKLLLQNVDKIDLEVASRIVKDMPSIFVYDKNLGPKAGELMKLRYTYSAPGVSSKSGKAKPGRHRILVDGGQLFKNLTNIANVQKTQSK